MGRKLFLFLFFGAGFIFADGSCTCGLNHFAGQSRIAIDKLLSHADIYLVEGKLHLGEKCKDKADWVYYYVSLDSKKSGWVRYALDNSCEIQETAGVDLDTRGMGYYLLRNFNKVKFGGSDAALVIQKSDGSFNWNGDFTLFQPLHPSVKEPLYQIFGTKDGQKVGYLVNGWTGEIAE